MKKFALGVSAMLIACLAIDATFAQPPEGDRRPRRDGEARPDSPEGRPEGRPDGRGFPGGPGEGRFPAPPLMIALDTDKDGELSAEEIANAVAALKTLDANKDGKLSREEMRPARGRDGDGERGRRGPDFNDFLTRYDGNKDGKLSKDELPERAQRMLENGDANKDGYLDKAELEKLSEQIRGRRPEGDRPEGRRPRGDRPAEARPRGEGDRPRGEGDRPRQRPSNDE